MTVKQILDPQRSANLYKKRKNFHNSIVLYVDRSVIRLQILTNSMSSNTEHLHRQRRKSSDQAVKRAVEQVERNHPDLAATSKNSDKTSATTDSTSTTPNAAITGTAAQKVASQIQTTINEKVVPAIITAKEAIAGVGEATLETAKEIIKNKDVLHETDRENKEEMTTREKAKASTLHLYENVNVKLHDLYDSSVDVAKDSYHGARLLISGDRDARNRLYEAYPFLFSQRFWIYTTFSVVALVAIMMALK